MAISTEQTGGMSGVTLPVYVDGRKMKFLVDTGADVTLLKEPVKGKLLKTEDTIRGVTGEAKRIQGKQKVKLEIAGQVLQHEIWIVPIDCEVDGILGLDVLRAVKAVIKIPDNQEVRINKGSEDSVVGTEEEEPGEQRRVHFVCRVRCNLGEKILEPGEGIILVQEGQPTWEFGIGRKIKELKLCYSLGDQRNPVKTKDRLILPPWSETIVKARISQLKQDPLVLEAASECPEGVRVCRMLVEPMMDNVWLKVANTTRETVEIGKGKELAQAYSLEKEVPVNCCQIRVGHTMERVTFQQELVKKLEHIPEEPRLSILELLDKYEDLFLGSLENKHAGKRTEHRIETGGAKPIAYRP